MDFPALVIVSDAAMKHDEHFHITVHCQRNSGQKLKFTGTWRQELMQRPCSSVPYFLLLNACSLCFLIEPWITRPEMKHPPSIAN